MSADPDAADNDSQNKPQFSSLQQAEPKELQDISVDVQHVLIWEKDGEFDEDLPKVIEGERN